MPSNVGTVNEIVSPDVILTLSCFLLIPLTSHNPIQYLGAKMSMYGINELFSLESFLSEITNRGAKQAIGPADDYGFKSVSKYVLSLIEP